MTLDSTHPARKFEGIFHLKNWASPARSVPSSHPDTLNLIKLFYVISARDRTLHLDGKPWELAKL